MKNIQEDWDVVVLGAGAAGMMAAAQAGQTGAKVLLLDHAAEPGRKILVSGGGRCNFTNLSARDSTYLSQNPRFVRSALAQFTPVMFCNLLRQHRVAWEEKEQGQLFCRDSARDIVGLLISECEKGRVALRFGCQIMAVTRCEQGFEIKTPQKKLRGRALILATGGLSIPKLGATDFSLQLARQFGLTIISPSPALVPLVLKQAYPDLAGVSLTVEASTGKKGPKFTAGMVFTHKGVSGPAILQISSYWQKGDSIRLGLLPGFDVMKLFEEVRGRRPHAQPPALLEKLPQRLGRVLAGGICDDRPLIEQPMKSLRALALRVERWELLPVSSEGYAKAEVMKGGIDTKMLSSQTMGVHSVPGLYVVGEAVDVTGWLGGYNFQWAWSSGYVAGRAASHYVRGLPGLSQGLS